MFQVKVKVSNPKNSSLSFEGAFWVDSGALYSVIPEDRLHHIQVQPIDQRTVIMADGRKDTRAFGACDMDLEGFKGPLPCPVIFGPKDSLLLLGATALESFGVDVDPRQKCLVPILTVLGGFLASK